MARISRRWLLMALGASCVPPIPTGTSFDGGDRDIPPLDDHDVSRVIIVGAGMAGLAAANALKRAGVDVLVVEARSRIGGRIHTLDVGGAHVDVGASWVHEPYGNPLRQLTSLAKLSLDAFDIEDFFSRGTLVDDGVAITGGALTDSLLALQAALDEVDADLTKTPDDPRAISEVMAQLAAKRGWSEAKKTRVDRALRVVFETNLSGAIEDTALNGYGTDPRFTGGDSIVHGGYSRLVDALAASVPVSLNREVVEISQGTTGVTVRFSDQSIESGSHVVLTLPLGVLRARAVSFTPALPAEKASAIENVGFGVFEKLVLQVGTVPSALGAARLTLADDSALPLLVDWSKPATTPTVVALSAGTFGRRFGQLSDDELVRTASDALGLDVRTSFRTRWADDPFTRGAYSWVPAGQSLSTLDALATPVGRVLFAGEHTSRARHATVDGAFASGIREAKRLLQQAAVDVAV
ncbi:MAG: NAD(P)/FAD-dependent oxidoreductase [Myxococcaceae bacterium]